MSEPQVFGAPAPEAEVPAPPPSRQPAAGGSTVLDVLLQDMARKAEVEDVTTLTVPARAGYEVRCRTDISYEELAGWNVAAADPSMPTGVNELLLGGTVLAQCVQAILINGEEVVGADGRALTFHSPELLASTKAFDAVDAVRRFYKRDGHIVASSRKLLAEAGYGANGVPTSR